LESNYSFNILERSTILTMSRFTRFAVPLVLLIALSEIHSTAAANVVSMANGQNDPDHGNFTNCGKAETNFHINWTPRVLKPGVTVTLSASWTVVKSFSHGDLCITIWLQGVQDPIYKDCHDQKCEDARKAILPYFPLPCPVPAGLPVKFPKFEYTLQPTIPLPSGKFTIHLTLTNEDKYELLCAHGDVEIIDE
jgi:hypothetical protein